ncbi:MAG: hypothetical protein U0931_35785 [Vulcanimicrobiota bacterium]
MKIQHNFQNNRQMAHQLNRGQVESPQRTERTERGEDDGQRARHLELGDDQSRDSDQLLPFGRHAYAMGAQGGGRASYAGGGRMGSAYGWAQMQREYQSSGTRSEEAAEVPAGPPATESQPTSQGNPADEPGGLESPEVSPRLDAATQAKMEEAQATTARRDASLASLAQGPVIVNGTEISQLDGYKAVSDASWDRFNGAYGNLPDSAKAAIQDQLTVVMSDWSQQPGNTEKYQAMAPGMQQEMIWSWQAQAAQNYGSSQAAEGNAADLVDLTDGARQYNEARQGYLAAGGTVGQ